MGKDACDHTVMSSWAVHGQDAIIISKDHRWVRMHVTTHAKMSFHSLVGEFHYELRAITTLQ